MEFSLFKIDDDVNVINKKLKNKRTFDILLKKDVDIFNPEIRIYSDVDLTGYNYAQIVHFGRYYFIEQIEPYPNGIYTFYLKCDVLKSFGNDILNYGKFIQSKQSVKVEIDIVESDTQTPQGVSYVLTTLGVDF